MRGDTKKLRRGSKEIYFVLFETTAAIVTVGIGQRFICRVSRSALRFPPTAAQQRGARGPGHFGASVGVRTRSLFVSCCSRSRRLHQLMMKISGLCLILKPRRGNLFLCACAADARHHASRVSTDSRGQRGPCIVRHCTTNSNGARRGR
jgi:hypothetical protein